MMASNVKKRLSLWINSKKLYDMKDAGILAKQYANALLNLSRNEKNLAEVEKSFDDFVNSAYKNPSFATFMNSPVIPQDKKEELLKQVLPKQAPALLGLFLKLVLAKKRFEILPLIESTFQALSEKIRGIRRAEYISATPIESATEKKLIVILEKKLAAEVRLVSKTDPALIGGFILKFDERVVDASYKTKLREMKQRLYATAV